MATSPKPRHHQLSVYDSVTKALSAGSLAVVTGSDVAVAAGIPLQRRHDGTWLSEEARIAPLRETLYDDPPRAWQWYAQRLYEQQTAQLTRCHRALASLEQNGYIRGVVTHNTDTLHQQAGSSTLALFGTLMYARCTYCQWRGMSADVVAEQSLWCEECGQPRRPAITTFGEEIDRETWFGALSWIDAAECVVFLGSSLSFPPVSLLPPRVRARGGEVFIVNEHETAGDDYATGRVYDDVQSWSAMVNELID